MLVRIWILVITCAITIPWVFRFSIGRLLPVLIEHSVFIYRNREEIFILMQCLKIIADY